jgi:plasmid stability protein
MTPKETDMTTLMETRSLDQELQDRIAVHAGAHHRRTERLHFAVTGSTDPIDEDREMIEEIWTLLRLAQPELDGDEEGAIQRLLDALEHGSAVTP